LVLLQQRSKQKEQTMLGSLLIISYSRTSPVQAQLPGKVCFNIYHIPSNTG